MQLAPYAHENYNRAESACCPIQRVRLDAQQKKITSFWRKKNPKKN